MVNLFKLLCICEVLNSEDDPIPVRRKFKETKKYKTLNFIRVFGQWYSYIVGAIIGVLLIPAVLVMGIGALIVSPGFLLWLFSNKMIDSNVEKRIPSDNFPL